MCRQSTSLYETFARTTAATTACEIHLIGIHSTHIILSSIPILLLGLMIYYILKFVKDFSKFYYFTRTSVAKLTPSHIISCIK